MSTLEVAAPAALLRDPALTPHARMIWLFLQMQGSARPSQVIRGVGMAPHTVRRGLAQLIAAGLAASGATGETTALMPDSSGPVVRLPADLFTARLGVQSRLLYGLLQTLPGQFTYQALEQLTGVSRHTLTRAVAELVHAGWLTTKQKHQHAPVRFELTTPSLLQPRTGVKGARWRIDRAEFKGEQIMREWLSLLVDSTQYEDGGFYGWLINPLTGEQLQLDRFYSCPAPGVGFEFNGAQHDGPTALFPSEEKARQQRARDLMKIGLCHLLKVPLVILHAEDLRLESMRQKVGNLLPLRYDLSASQALIGFLERRSQRHRENGA